jgi:hypothetical protein
MSLSIPDPARAPLAKLLALTPENRKRLVAAVCSVKPKLRIADWVSAVSEGFGADRGDIEDIVSTVVTLYRVRAMDPGQSVEDLVADLRSAAERSGDSSLAKPEAWAAVASDVAALLSADDTLGVTAKALAVMTGVERNFLGSHVLTDLRPVFGSEITPAAGVVVHYLAITFSQDGETREIVFGLDSNDLRTVNAVLERAMKKEASLRKFMEQTKLPIFEVPK